MDHPSEQDNGYGAFSGSYPPNPGPSQPLSNPSTVAPPPRPPSTPYGSDLYDDPYNPNPYDPLTHTPSPFDNPNSLYTNSGQVIGRSTPTPDPHPPYGPPGSTPASDRCNSPAPLPRVTSQHNDYLNPSSAIAGGPRVHCDANDGPDGGAIPLLRRDGASAITPVDGSSMRESCAMPSGFDPALLPESDENNIRFGRIPQRVPRRYKTKKRYELFHGNLAIDNQVPSKLLDVCPLKSEREFKFMRYTAATCDPNDFKSEGYTLRPAMYEPARRTELFIVMTMYNEDEELFTRTMQGVIRNVAHLCTRERSKTWGKDGWKKVVVCIVSDGRRKIHSRTLSVIAAMGCYQDGVGKNAVNGKLVTAHIYEYTTQISISPSLEINSSGKDVCPVQVIFCLKEKNQKKINSHRWFFNAFGPVLEPNICVLLDVGTTPGPVSIYHLWKAFDIDSNVGGACGEIVALKGKLGVNLINPLVAAQNFEYKMNNILNKPFESIFGYITVLPGAFSAYRYIALQNDRMGEGPLQQYFLGETMHHAGADIFTANMYLAEARILCWELVSKRGGQWILHYVKSAYAVTDVPDQVPELISQRRRWLNGSFFAAIHSTVKFHYIYRSSHTFARKAWLHVELAYQVFNLIFSWFALGNYYIAFYILSNAMEDKRFNIAGIHVINLVLDCLYLGLLVMCYLLAIGNRPQGSKWGYTFAFIGFAVITIYMTFAAFFLAIRGVQVIESELPNGRLQLGDVFNNAIFLNIVISLLATTGLYFIASFLSFEPWHMFSSFIQYVLMALSYTNVLNVYAFANVHDVSWGTKGDNKAQTDLGTVRAAGKNKNEVEVDVPTEQTDINAAYEDAIHVLQQKPEKVDQKRDAATKQEDYYRSVRTNVLLVWTLTNGLLAVAVISTAARADDKGMQATVSGFMAFVLFSVAGLAFVRFVGSLVYLIVRLYSGE